MRRKTINEIQIEFNKEGYVLLTSEYQNKHTLLNFICPNQHKSNIKWQLWKAGHRCSECFKEKNRYNFKEVKQFISEQQYKLLETQYINNHIPLKLECPNNHLCYISFANFKDQNVRCKSCRAQDRMQDFDYIKKQLKDSKYTCLSTKYSTSKDKLRVKCNKGHMLNIRWNDFQQGVRCRKCMAHTSKAEKAIKEYLLQLSSNLRIDEHNREVLNPYEIDIYLPDLKVGIEHHGIYWHSDRFDKNKTIHQQKFLLAKQNGIRLIQIFEDEWLYKQDIVKARLKHILGLDSEFRLFARNCDIRKITMKVANEFCKQYHIQGKGSGNIAYGLFYTTPEGLYELCSVMTFAKPNLAKGGKGKTFIELSRFCSSRNIVGGASRLFKAFLKEHAPKEIISYCDVRWGNGKVYEQLGMSLETLTKPNYYYIEGTKRLHRFNFRKDVLIKKFGADPKKTEKEITQELGLKRVYDAGNYKFKWVDNSLNT